MHHNFSRLSVKWDWGMNGQVKWGIVDMFNSLYDRWKVENTYKYYIGQIEDWFDSKMNRSRYTHMREESIDGVFIHSRNFGYNMGNLKSPVVIFYSQCMKHICIHTYAHGQDDVFRKRKYQIISMMKFRILKESCITIRFREISFIVTFPNHRFRSCAY